MRRSLFFLVNFSPIFMPALSPSMETGVIVEWKKKVGDLVKENEVFCTVQTDKAVVDYTNTFEAGYLAKIFHNNGETVTVAKTIGVMVDDPSDISKANEFTPEGEEPAAEETTTTTTEKAAEETSKSSGGNSELPEDVNASPIFMPALSPSMETGVIVEWKKKVGDLVKENEVFCTVQTDKAVVDYTNTFEAGYLAKIFHNNGETVTVAKTIALLVENAEDIPKLANYSPAGDEAPTSTSNEENKVSTSTIKKDSSLSSTSGGKRYGGSLEEAIAASGPGVMRIAARLDKNILESITPTGKDGRFSKSDFIGQPGFNYNDVPPPPPASSSSTSAVNNNKNNNNVKKSSTGVANTQGSVGVLVKTFPVYNFKVSDTTVLEQLIRTMPAPKMKKSKVTA